MKSIFHVRAGRTTFLAILYLISVAHIICHGETSSTNNDEDNQPPDSRIVQSLFRFPASKLGPEFDELLQNWYTDALYTNYTSVDTNNNTLPTIRPHLHGTYHAFKSVSTPAATLFRRQCYTPYPQTSTLHNNLYNNYEQRRKEISFQYNKNSKEEMRLLHTMTKRFYPALLPEEKGKDANNRRMHKKKSTSTVNTIHAQSTLPADYDSPSKLSFQTGVSSSKLNEEEEDVSNNEQQWSWYPPAHFSSRGTSYNMPFRMKMYRLMRNALQERIQQLIPNFSFDNARQSGMFWYPPGGVREWHTNKLDLVGNTKGVGKTKSEEIFASQTWRMYFVRTVRDSEFDKKLTKLRKGEAVDTSINDHSALHIIPDNDEGITLDVLEKAGARRLTIDEEKRQYSDEFAEDYTPRMNKSDEPADLDGTGFDRNAVWRLPDIDGYITLFRIPDLWHCITSEEVHRYSLGFAFSDKEVQALLTLADWDFDVISDDKRKADTLDIKEEL